MLSLKATLTTTACALVPAVVTNALTVTNPALSRPSNSYPKTKYLNTQFYSDESGSYFFHSPLPTGWHCQKTYTNLNELTEGLELFSEENELNRTHKLFPDSLLKSQPAIACVREYRHGLVSRQTLENLSAEITEFQSAYTVYALKRIILQIDLKGNTDSSYLRNSEKLRSDCEERFYDKNLQKFDELRDTNPIRALNHLQKAARARNSSWHLARIRTSKELTERFDAVCTLLPFDAKLIKSYQEFNPLHTATPLLDHEKTWVATHTAKLKRLTDTALKEAENRFLRKDFRGAYYSAKQVSNELDFGNYTSVVDQKRSTELLLNLLPKLDYKDGFDCYIQLKKLRINPSQLALQKQRLIRRYLEQPIPENQEDKEALANNLIELNDVSTFKSVMHYSTYQHALCDKLSALLPMVSKEVSQRCLWSVLELSNGCLENIPAPSRRQQATALLHKEIELYSKFLKECNWSFALETLRTAEKTGNLIPDFKTNPQYRWLRNQYKILILRADEKTAVAAWEISPVDESGEQRLFLKEARERAQIILTRHLAEIDEAIAKGEYSKSMEHLNRLAATGRTPWRELYPECQRVDFFTLIDRTPIGERMRALKAKVPPVDAALIDYWIEFYKF